MKTKFLHLLAFVAFVNLAATMEAKGQELPNPEYNGYQFQEPNAYDEKPLILESDLKYPKAPKDSTNHSRTTTTTSKAGNKTTATQGKSTSGGRGDDPLNFNFLYYIIQKFKTSDLIDQ